MAINLPINQGKSIFSNMVKIIAALSLILFFSACTSSVDQRQLKAINDCLEKSNSFIETASLVARKGMEDKLMDPFSHESALIWITPATSIQQLASDVRSYIDSLKPILMKGKEFNKDQKSELFRKIDACRQLIPMVFDTITMLKPQIKKDMLDLTRQSPLLQGYPSQTDKAQITSYERNWIDSNFSSTNPLMTLASLNKIQNEINSWEYKWLKYCNIHINRYLCGFDNPFLADMSDSLLKAGQLFAVYAGVFDYPLFRNPQVTIDGTLVKPGPDGIASCAFKAAGKGDHKIPVIIEYTRPDGTRDKVFKTLRYIVAE